jgi:flagellar biogenesis protein FliO
MMLGLIIALFAFVGFYVVMRFTSFGKKERSET